jgi:branched-chain amino acid transport system permease protein
VFVLAFLIWESRASAAFTPVIVTRALDRAIAPSHDASASSSHGGTLALRLHYPVRASEGKGTLVNGRMIRALILVGIIAFLPLILRPFWSDQLIGGLAFGIFFLSFALIVGEGGMIWLCQLAFAGIGAAMTAYLTTVDHIPMMAAIFASGVMVVPAGLLLALLTTRIGQLQAALATLAFAVLTDKLILTQPALAGLEGNGLVVSTPGFINGVHARFYFVFGVFCIAALLVEHFRRSTAGLAASAVRWTTRGATSIGIDPRSVHLQLGGLSALIAGIGGGFLTMYFQSDTPGTFNVSSGLLLLAVAATIGIRSNMAAALAGVSFTVMPAIIQTYFPLSLANLPPAMFGLGAVFIVNNPDGVVEQHLRQVLWITRRVKWIGGIITGRVAGTVPVPAAIGAADTAPDEVGEGAKVASFASDSRDER